MQTPALHITNTPCPAGHWWAHGNRFFSNVRSDPFQGMPPKVAFRRFRLVKIDITQTGTSIRWDLEHASQDTIETTLDRLHTFKCPITLTFFKRAWAVEQFQSWEPAAQRILQLNELQKLSRVVTPDIACVTSLNPRNSAKMVPLIRRASEGLDPGLPDQQVFFRYDDRADTFVLEKIGRKSGLFNIMGRLWAQNAIGTTAAPTDEEGFDDAVMPPYWQVLETGRTVFDEVSAMMHPPAQEPMWFKYQRLIKPWICDDQRIGCVVTTMRIDQAMPSSLIVSAK